MGYENLYNSPERKGLKIVFSNDIAGSYEFDTVVVWKAIDGEQYYYAHDSGCSCPIPFDDYNEISDLTPIETHNFEQFEQSVRRHLEPQQIRDIRQAVFKARFGRKLGQTKTIRPRSRATSHNRNVDKRSRKTANRKHGVTSRQYRNE